MTHRDELPNRGQRWGSFARHVLHPERLQPPLSVLCVAGIPAATRLTSKASAGMGLMGSTSSTNFSARTQGVAWAKAAPSESAKALILRLMYK